MKDSRIIMSEYLALLKSLNPSVVLDFYIPENSTSVRIGRHLESDIRIDDVRCSIKHLEIRVSSEDSLSFELTDTSSNGSFVNGVLVGRNNTVSISFNDTITVLKREISEDKFVEFQLISPLKRSEDLLPAQKLPTESVRFNDQIHCSICLELLHQPFLLVPCCHSFCAGCLSVHFRDNTACPDCKTLPNSVKADRFSAFLVKEYLKINPKMCRSPEALAKLDRENVFVEEVIEFKENRKNEGKCRQCGHGEENFKCEDTQEHRACTQCSQLMPTRNKRNQQCENCLKFFCNLYWVMGPKCTDGIQPINSYINTTFRSMSNQAFNGNRYEQHVLKNHINKKGVSFFWVANTLVRKMETENWIFAGKQLKKDSYVCAECALYVWNELLYVYRVSVNDEIPKYITAREACEHGRNCLMQGQNIVHAQEFNHIQIPIN